MSMESLLSLLVVVSKGLHQKLCLQFGQKWVTKSLFTF